MSHDTKTTLDNDESAVFLKISPSTLNTWRCHGRGPKYYKIGRRVVYKLEDLEAFLNSRLVRTRESEEPRRPAHA